MLKRIKRITFNSIKFKVSLFYTAILGVILVFYTAILFLGQSYALYLDLDNELAVKAQGVASAINSILPALEDDQRSFGSVVNMVIRQDSAYSKQGKISEIQKQLLAMSDKLDIHNDYVVLANSEGKAIASSQNLDGALLPYFLKNIAGSGEKAVAYSNLNFDKYRLRLITIPYYYKSKRMYLIEVGISRSPIIKTLYGRVLFASLIIPVILVFTSFFGGLITKRILNPVMEVTNIAKNITYKDLSARVKVDKVDEELRYLVDAFNEMISRLDNSFRYIDEFSSNVAHELKTPLTIISGESELALMKDRNINECRRVMEVNIKAAAHMRRIVDDLLLLSRLEYQPEAFKFEQINFSVFIKEIFEWAKKLGLSKDISVELTMADKEITILADQMHLRRLFINLLNNAVKFTPSGGKITIAVKPEAEKVSVSVSDTGIGIASGDTDKIFRRFSRLDYTGSADKSGSGLGLSIAQSIAKIHHGVITVSSELGKGATFTITFPNCNIPQLP